MKRKRGSKIGRPRVTKRKRDQIEPIEIEQVRLPTNFVRLPAELKNMISEFHRGDKAFWKEQKNVVFAELKCHGLCAFLAGKPDQISSYLLGRHENSFVRLMPNKKKRVHMIHAMAEFRKPNNCDEKKAKQFMVKAGIPKKIAAFLVPFLDKIGGCVRNGKEPTEQELRAEITPANDNEVMEISAYLMFHKLDKASMLDL